MSHSTLSGLKQPLLVLTDQQFEAALIQVSGLWIWCPILLLLSSAQQPSPQAIVEVQMT